MQLWKFDGLLLLDMFGNILLHKLFLESYPDFTVCYYWIGWLDNIPPCVGETLEHISYKCYFVIPNT